MTYLPKEYKIEKIIKYTEDVKLFRIKCNINPMPGSFFEVSVPGVGECPLASCSYNKNYIDLLTRNAGNVTSKMFQLRKNDKVFIRGPYGKGFPIEKLKGKNLILVAGGTGIAPVTSMIEYVEKNKKNFGDVFIYFGFRNEDYILLKERIDKLKRMFNVFVCLSDDLSCKNYEKGFVHEIVKKNKPKLKNTVAVMCGPDVMMEAVTRELNKMGLKNNNLYWSLERRMECAFGSCGRCQIQDVYVCRDGPVFRYDKIKQKLDNEKSCEVKV